MRKLSANVFGVVRSLKALGGLPEPPGTSFKAETEVPVEKGWRRENLRAVVFVRERGTRRVLAAASLKLFESGGLNPSHGAGT